MLPGCFCAMSGFKKILTHWRKGIQQRTGLQANAAVHDVRLLIQRVACGNDVLFITDGEFEFTGQHVGQLLVRVVVQRPSFCHRARECGGLRHCPDLQGWFLYEK